ncbi:MAG: hypothetical protein EZS28_036741, partial [Streblomastix strix]
TGCGGAIYLQISDGGELLFDLSGVSYSGCDAKYGKSLFINAQGDLKLAVPVGQGIKIGAGTNDYEYANLDNLMGKDDADELPIPLYYVYSAREQGVYHAFYTNTEQGINNAGCGHLQFPCQSIDYALSLNPSSANPIKAGIISGYWIYEQISIGEAGKITQIQSQIELLEDYSYLLNFDPNSFACSYEVIFQDLHFEDQGGAAGQVIDLVDATSKVSILNCKLNLTDKWTTFKHKFINVEYGNLTITNLIVNSIKYSNSNLINIGTSAVIVNITSSTFGSTSADMYYSENSRLIQATISGSLIVNTGTTFLRYVSASNGGVMNLEIVNNGKVELSGVLMQDCKGAFGGGIYTEISGSGKLTIKDGCSFMGCQATAGNGGAIYAQIKSGTSGGLSITGTTKTTFTSCQALPTDSGLGGSIYLDLQSGTETKYDLTGASYSTTNINDALYGKNLFIKAANLRTAVPIGDSTRIKLGAINPETDFYKLIGFDGANTLAVPLYYVYTAIINDIYHVNNAAGSYMIGSGYDNIFCGHYGWPCLTIDYSIQQTGSIAEKKIGIINEYKLGSLIQIDQSGKEVKIFNSLTSTGSTSTTQSILLIEQAGKFSVTNGTLSFDKIIFSINTNALEGYIITGSTQSTKIQIDNCIMKTTAASSTIKTGLVEVEYGILSIANLNVKDIKIQERCVIKVNEGSNIGIVSIIGSKFENIIKTGGGNGSVIEGYLSNSNGKISISKVDNIMNTFTDCKVDSSTGCGGAIYLQISDGGELLFDLSGVSYSGCDAK